MIYPFMRSAPCVGCFHPHATRIMLFKREIKSPFPPGSRLFGLRVHEFATVCNKGECVEAVLADPAWTWAAAPNKDALPR